MAGTHVSPQSFYILHRNNKLHPSLTVYFYVIRAANLIPGNKDPQHRLCGKITFNGVKRQVLDEY